MKRAISPRSPHPHLRQRHAWRTLLSLGAALMVAWQSSALARGDVYSIVDASKLVLAEKDAAIPASMSEFLEGGWQYGDGFMCGVQLDGSGEVFLDIDAANRNIVLLLKTPERRAVTGRLRYLESWNKLKQTRFEIASEQLRPADAEQFQNARKKHYERLASANLPGAAWFRHLAGTTTETNGRAVPLNGNDDLSETFDMFSGAQAIAENLRLETVLRTNASESATLEVAKIDGIQTRAFDFKPLLAGKEPALDTLANFIPDDQHAAFFPSFVELVNVADELKRLTMGPSTLIDERSIDSLTMERIERQLCLPASDLARRFGSLLVKQAAVTGSDPFLRSGSDVAVLFETRDQGTTALVEFWKANAKQRGALETGKSGTLDYTFVRTADRSTSSYLVAHGSTVLITNSPAQIAAFDAVLTGAKQPLASGDDYRFFRDRYSRNDAESVLIVIPDAALRRWVSPRYRIADSRRVRALGRLAEERASRVEDFAASRTKEIVEPVDPVYGSLSFATPLAEISVERCTQSEADSYARFRNTYERGFSAFFDPIAVRLRFTEERLEGDVTVIPIILDSDLNEFFDVVKDARLTAQSGHPHDLAVAQFTLAIDPKAESVKMFSDLLSGRDDKLTDPLAWVGNWVTMYIDDDPFLEELHNAEKPEQFLEEEVHRLPIAFEVAVKDAVRAGLFITTLRLIADQSVPGLLKFETMKHGEKSYVRVHPSQDLIGDRDVNIFYAIDAKRLVVSLNEGVVKRSLDDSAATTNQQAGNALGESATAHVDHRVFDFFSRAYDADQMRHQSMRALPILEEWHRLFPSEDPVAFHERVFHERIICPSGGKYVIDSASGEVRSEALGTPFHPIDPKGSFDFLKGWQAADFGLTFEHGGVRGRVAVTR